MHALSYSRDQGGARGGGQALLRRAGGQVPPWDGHRTRASTNSPPARIDDLFRSLAAEATVWTFGEVKFHPGSQSVVPGHASLRLQFRDQDTELLERMDAGLKKLIEEINSGQIDDPVLKSGVLRVVQMLFRWDSSGASTSQSRYFDLQGLLACLRFQPGFFGQIRAVFPCANR